MDRKQDPVAGVQTGVAGLGGLCRQSRTERRCRTAIPSVIPPPPTLRGQTTLDPGCPDGAVEEADPCAGPGNRRSPPTRIRVITGTTVTRAARAVIAGPGYTRPHPDRLQGGVGTTRAGDRQTHVVLPGGRVHVARVLFLAAGAVAKVPIDGVVIAARRIADIPRVHQSRCLPKAAPAAARPQSDSPSTGTCHSPRPAPQRPRR
jgi:hypothetical protein